ncbi:type 1 glutamine amidotransferase [Dyadobacter arcticus]|uniref:GMP synthase-like glutamine amidotransferase n=1 Tax=Dyadobacter arcticus TaxID=1078754 RepID=A0ABX0UQQ0_9BACT|nr:GMP synthase [Dyadobacter arcticus]NIJ54264.1 GMP synthase-like glutamine amidotransferase [Dyadobacter arcticus]
MTPNNKHFRIAILDMYNGHDNEGMRCIKNIIANFGVNEAVHVDFTVFDVRQKLEIPGLEFDAYISTGGPGNPSPVGEIWEKKFFSFLDHLLQFNAKRQNRIKKHLFLICHSFQMACIHWELAGVSKRRKTSFGTFPVYMTSTGRKDPLLQGLADPFWIVDSRDFQVTQPNPFMMENTGAKLLCLEKIRPHVPLERAVMAIRFSNEIVGTQFHPEADAEGMLRYFLRDDKKTSIISALGEAKYNDMIEHLNDPDKISLTESRVIPAFLKNALNKTFPLAYA